MRHLTEQQAVAALERGASIEQMVTTALGTGSVCWVELVPVEGSFSLFRHETYDDGTDEFFDVYAFRSADPDEDADGILLGIYPDAPTALRMAVRGGARPDRWVDQGVIQDEYADLRATLTNPDLRIDNGSDGIWFDPWTLRFAQAMLTGLIDRQNAGGLRVRSFELKPDADALRTVIEHYDDPGACRLRLGTHLVLSTIRRDIPDDPDAAAGTYLPHLTHPALPPDAELEDNISWIVRPPLRGT